MVIAQSSDLPACRSLLACSSNNYEDEARLGSRLVLFGARSGGTDSNQICFSSLMSRRLQVETRGNANGGNLSPILVYHNRYVSSRSFSSALRIMTSSHPNIHANTCSFSLCLWALTAGGQAGRQLSSWLTLSHRQPTSPACALRRDPSESITGTSQA